MRDTEIVDVILKRTLQTYDTTTQCCREFHELAAFIALERFEQKKKKSER